MVEIHLCVYFQDGGRPPYWISYSPFCTPTTSSCRPIVTASGVMIRSDVTEILRFYDFADLAGIGKCLFTPLLGSLGIIEEGWLSVDRNELVRTFRDFCLSATFREN